jgi:hypothetical protein
MELLLVHAAVTWGLVGLIWNVQLVQYPAFALVGQAEFAAYHRHHCARITWIVAPLMALELLTAIALLAAPPAGLSAPMLAVGATLLAVNWASTAFVAVPLHGRVSGRAREVQRRLVATNWIRTAAWSARGAWVVAALLAALQPVP